MTLTRLPGRACVLAIVCALAPLSGCQPADGLAAVEGTVLVDGAPPDSGQIDFFPAPGAGNPVGGRIANGAYRLRAPVGIASVQIRVPKVVGQKRLYNTPDSPVRDILAEALPEKYNERSVLSFDVQPGKNVKDFSLSTSD